MEIEKTNRMNALFEFYAALLTDKQMNYIELYYADDYSLAEIAEEFGVSRQAVYDNIKRTEKILEAYEMKLHMYFIQSSNENFLHCLEIYVHLILNVMQRYIQV